MACTLRLAGDVAGRDVLDVACGQGLDARALAQAGAGSVIGVDSSPRMLVIEAVEEPRPSALLAEQQPEYAQVPIFWATARVAPRPRRDPPLRATP